MLLDVLRYRRRLRLPPDTDPATRRRTLRCQGATTSKISITGQCWPGGVSTAKLSRADRLACVLGAVRMLGGNDVPAGCSKGAWSARAPSLATARECAPLTPSGRIGPLAHDRAYSIQCRSTWGKKAK